MVGAVVGFGPGKSRLRIFLGCCLAGRIICVCWVLTILFLLRGFLQSPEMPESRDGRRPALADLSGGVGGGGFFIRRVASPGALAVRKPLARRYMSPSRNKENLLPVWALRATPTKRSPLPAWYPRTPLRDITAIAKVCIVFQCYDVSN